MVPIEENERFIVTFFLQDAEPLTASMGSEDIQKLSNRLGFDKFNWINSKNGMWGIKNETIASVQIQKEQDLIEEWNIERRA